MSAMRLMLRSKPVQLRFKIGRLLGPVLFSALVLLAGCSDEAQPVAISEGAVVLAFGDSLTFGTGARPEQSYPSRLADLTHWNIVNAGVPGELSAQGLKRLPELLEKHRPELLILCHGGNDLLRRKNDAQTAGTIGQMIQLALDQQIQVVLVAVPKPTVILSDASFYEEIAQQYPVVFVDQLMTDVLSDNRLKADAAHPNAAGYQQFTQQLFQQLQDAGLIIQ